MPRLDLGAGPSIQQPASIATGASHGSIPATQYRYTAQGIISYEVDLFGKNRAASNAAEFNAEGADAAYQAALLSLEADVAQAYYALRSLDREQEILNTTQKLREETRDLTRRSLKIGDVSELDVTRAESELAATKAEALGVSRRRAEAEHNLALLLGKPPAALTMDKHAIKGVPPMVPAGLPSELLERRPDIQAAQKRMAAANETIGVARAAFFPVLNLTAIGGFQSGQLGQLFDWSSRSWLLGPFFGTVATLPIFDAGRNFSNLALSKSEFQEAVATYRQNVLVAFREVEDQLSGLYYLKGQADAQAEAVRAARKAFSISKTRYENGYISYLEFIDAQRSLLAAERAEVQVLGGRYIATVQLIRALGGSWENGLGTDNTVEPALAADSIATKAAP
ncbi:MAG: efflux transporter outer membrane subunit [Alphaproteobacteria bacterium]|nr:efflux transporter outer membrane subunit [Alphaproteobacteria bacterium]